MCDHSESVYKNNCIKVAKNKCAENATCLSRQVQKLRISSADSNTKEKTKINSFIEFYDSIPEYNDINHLSNKEFYKKLDYLRQKQRTFYESLVNEEKYGDNEHNSWYDNYKSLNNHRNSIIKAKNDDVVTQKPPSRRSVRIGSPEVIIDKNRRPKSYKDESLLKSSREHVSSAGSTSRYKSNRHKSNKSPFCDSTLDEMSDCTLTTRSVPCSPRKQSVAWKDNNTTQSNTPDTFKMTVRNENDKIIDEIVINKKANKTNDGMFRANPVPIESRIPLFDKIISKQVKQRSKEALKAQMNLFSFTKREEEISDITRRLTKSSPDLFLCFDKQKKPKQFRAKPVPKNLFSNYAYQKMNEDEYYRSLQKKIRAEEMLKTASLPPSMAKREKTKSKYHICPKSFREMYESQMRKIPPSRRKDLEKELAELELDFIMATPSPVNVNKPKSNKSKRKNTRKSSSSSSGKSSRSPSTLESVNRSNLAAVLRIQSSRKRMEDEICRRIEEAHLKEEARWREKVLRKKPVWQTLTYSHEEDLNMRLQMRRDEERMRNEEFRMQMETMFGRVNQQPTLFERQSNVKLAKTKEELISQLYGPSPSSDKFSHSNESLRKCVEMKDEGIQAKLDDVFDPNENGPEQKEEFITDSVDTDDN
ncbi:protein FAM161A isoform X2 [Atheta coriaria]|uniref:protein FAM161A isoform X2 n=1 Tax=Dalotia coriaria TaxID=877792 RepID=UPI0031F464C0